MEGKNSPATPPDQERNPAYGNLTPDTCPQLPVWKCSPKLPAGKYCPAQGTRPHLARRKTCAKTSDYKKEPASKANQKPQQPAPAASRHKKAHTIEHWPSPAGKKHRLCPSDPQSGSTPGNAIGYAPAKPSQIRSKPVRGHIPAPHKPPAPKKHAAAQAAEHCNGKQGQRPPRKEPDKPTKTASL